jgi:AraC-like DNA-binding protein
MVVRAALDELGLQYGQVYLGEVDVFSDFSEGQRSELKRKLQHYGLELMDEKAAVLVDKIKSVIIEMIHYVEEDDDKIVFSRYLEEKLKQDYTTMAGLFSVVTGITIEHYIIQHKIEKVKELLLYENLNLTEIAHRMNYSSVSHLSYQFKKVTGLTPSFFKKIKSERIQLKKEEVGNSILTKDIL